jgi:hypothetical protein
MIDMQKPGFFQNWYIWPGPGAEKESKPKIYTKNVDM